MTTQALPRPGWLARARQTLLVALGTTLAVLGPNLRATARPAIAHVREHAYSIAGLGCISAASFVHSTFTGLLVTGLMFLVFEWKVSE
jgi:hypothetical protein